VNTTLILSGSGADHFISEGYAMLRAMEAQGRRDISDVKLLSGAQISVRISGDAATIEIVSLSGEYRVEFIDSSTGAAALFMLDAIKQKPRLIGHRLGSNTYNSVKYKQTFCGTLASDTTVGLGFSALDSQKLIENTKFPVSGRMGGTLIYRSKAFEAQTIPAGGVISLGSIQAISPSEQLYYPHSVPDPCAGNTWKTSAYKASATTITSSAIYADSSIFGPGQAIHTITYQYNTVYLWDNEDGTAPSPPNGAIYMSRTTKLLDPATNAVTRVASTQYWVPSTVLLSDGTILPITNPGYIATLFADNNGYMSNSNKHVDGGSWGNVPGKAMILLGIDGPSVTTWAIGMATPSGVKIQSILPVSPASPATTSIGGIGVFYLTAVGGSTWILSGLYTNSVTGAIATDYRVSKDDGVHWAVAAGPPYTGTVLNMSYTMILDTREQLPGYATLPIMVLVRTSTGTSGYISRDACTSWELAWTLDAKYALLGEVVPIGKYALDRG
jgi:hypothetical protein